MRKNLCALCDRSNKGIQAKITIHTTVCTMFILRSLIAETSPNTSIELMTPFSSLVRIISIARKTPVLQTPALTN